MTTTHPRIRTGFLDLQWPSTGLRVGIEKPIVAPRSPSSLAQQIYPAPLGPREPLALAATSQARAEIHIRRKRTSGPGGTPADQRRPCRFRRPGVTLQPRPAWEGRLAFARRFEGDRAIEFAPGFHYSRTLASGTSVPSQLITGDWRIAPSHQWELTGAFFTGRNAGPIGGLRQGIVIVEPGAGPFCRHQRRLESVNVPASTASASM